MRFALPNFPCEFDIPDEWLAEAGIVGFSITEQTYRSTSEAIPIALSEITPPPRVLSVPKDRRGFERSRLIKVLREIVSGAEIWPVPLRTLYNPQGLSTPYRYCVADGYHRFHAAIIAGYDFLPSTID